MKVPIIVNNYYGAHARSASIIDQPSDQPEIINQAELNNEHHVQNKILIIQTKFKFRKILKLIPRPKKYSPGTESI